MINVVSAFEYTSTDSSRPGFYSISCVVRVRKVVKNSSDVPNRAGLKPQIIRVIVLFLQIGFKGEYDLVGGTFGWNMKAKLSW